MNLILIEPHELDQNGRAVLAGRRATHIQSVLRAQAQDSLRAGVLGQNMGVVRIHQIENDKVHVEFEARQEPPKSMPLQLILALPRPKVLKRVIAHITTLGVKDIYLINAYRVEKPYWSSEQAQPEFLRQASLLGLEQARDTILPRIHLRKLFKPFVQDELPEIIKGTRAFVAHPTAESPAPASLSGPLTLTIGPEGGFIPYEVERLQAAGIQPIQIGKRILKFETAIAFLAGRMVQDL